MKLLSRYDLVEIGLILLFFSATIAVIIGMLGTAHLALNAKACQ